MSVVAHFTKLKRLWDELTCFIPIPVCTCGSAKAVADRTSFNQLIQFLMRLNECYDHRRNQILVMDPLPSVNKAYSMILRVEKQRQVNMGVREMIGNSAMLLKAQEYRKQVNYKGTVKKRIPLDKKQLYCDHFDKPGHQRETCFKIHGFPDWYKELADQKKRKSGTARVFAGNTEMAGGFATSSDNKQCTGERNVTDCKPKKNDPT